MNVKLSRRASRILASAAGAALLCASAWAATPASGTVSESASQAAWTGGPGVPTAAATCGSPSNTSCDNYKLTIVPPSYGFKVEIKLALQATDDYDLEVYGPDGALAASSGNGPGQAETVVLNNPAAGTYTVSASPYAALTAYAGSAKITQLAPPPAPSKETPPRYASYTPPNGKGQSAGEPTLGVNERTGSVMYIAGTETLKVDFNDCTSPATANWQDRSALLTSQVTFDPILFTDQALGRTFVSQLLPTKVSLMAWSDNDGLTWLPSQGAGINSGVDHQSIGGGPFAPGLLQPLTSYPHIVYYCSQDIAMAQCATSLDGGTTFGPAVPIYNITQCGGLHGHVKVGPDGTAYVPNKSCGGGQGFAVSRDNGLTWAVKEVPGSSGGEWDPSVGIATDGTVYFGYEDGDGHPKVAVSLDGGDTWAHIVDVGVQHGLQNIAFPVVVAGDPDRAAFAFLGTTTGGDLGGDDPNAPAVWHLYVAHTYDGGATWVTANATPGDPVQRGTICSSGTTCGSTRNLLDFMDVVADAQGRVLVGFADGCVGGCVNGGTNSGTALATIARQSSGKGLYAGYDLPVGLPAAPAVEAAQANGTVHLTWSTPDDHGSPILEYRLSRRAAGGAFEQFASVGADVHSYDDTPRAGTTYSYRVKAVNGQGEGPACREVFPTQAVPATQSCTAPGTQVAADPAGDVPVAALDVKSLSVAEPPGGSSQKIVFTLKVGSLASFTPGSAWMILWNRPAPDATYDRNYVVMRASGLGTVSFKYGKVSPPNLNQGTDLGNATGSFSADGTITISLTGAQADGIGAGQDLPALEARTFALNVSGMPVSQATAVDFAGGNYTLAGSAHCGG
ncbi:MAG TPA: fibronectin type III domain-containing protein [Thermoanaerobaculia bacterium]|nr:fibronectin type III domain-containing protein [Thermoanaerobaculia bacterium]